MLNQKEEQKQRAFEEHKDIITWVWWIGKGLMFRSQLIRHFQLFGYSKPIIEEAIRDLIQSELLEVVRFGNSHVLKLRKFGIYMVLGKEPGQVGSVRITSKTKFLRTAYLSERILGVLVEDPSNLKRGVEHNISIIKLLMSHVAFEKQSYLILKLASERDVRNEKKGKLPVLSESATKEIERLSIVSEFAGTGKQPEEAKRIRIEKQVNSEIFKEEVLNLNGMQSRDIYFRFSVPSDKKGYVLDLDFLDVSSSMTERQLEKKIKMAYYYMDDLVSPAVRIQMNVLVAGRRRASYFESKVDRIRAKFSNSKELADFRINVINLNLEETLFARMTILN
ncbi:hypothetical protein [Sporosarcina sp. FSL K6-5500]|uniref:hypothetical protein n=1 Tax=Sporosarcina sp. FSL K6-5500 TaxID=2921558 RepID=UPI0030FA7B0B